MNYAWYPGIILKMNHSVVYRYFYRKFDTVRCRDTSISTPFEPALGYIITCKAVATVAIVAIGDDIKHTETVVLARVDSALPYLLLQNDTILHVNNVHFLSVIVNNDNIFYPYLVQYHIHTEKC